MGLEEVKNAIVHEAKLEAKQRINEGKKKASEIVSIAKKKARETEKRFLEKLDQDLESLEKHEIASMEFTTRKKVMVRKKELLDEFFDLCMETALARSAAERKGHIKTLVKQIRGDFPITTIYTNKKDMLSLPGIKCVVADIKGGVILENSDGTQRVNLSYEVLLDQIRLHNLSEIASALFGE